MMSGSRFCVPVHGNHLNYDKNSSCYDWVHLPLIITGGGGGGGGEEKEEEEEEEKEEEKR